MAPLCTKCRNEIVTKRCIKCHDCEGIFHVPDCTKTVSENRFNLMTPTRKSKWKCEPCKESIIDKGISKSTLQEINFENVTMRSTKTNYKLNISTENSFESLPLDENDDDEEYSSIASPHIMNRSCPEISECNREVIKELENTIQQLQQKLESADNEIVNLLAENSSLMKLNQKYESKMKTLMQIYNSPIQITPAKLNRKSLSRTKLNLGMEKTYSTPTQSDKQKSNLDTTKGDTHSQTPIITTKLKNISKFQNNNELSEKRKICILSTNKKNKIVKIAENIIPQQYSLCHYLTPECGIKYLVNNIKTKLYNYTMQDFCVLIIGEEDFKKTTDIQVLLRYIRKALQEIKHTNVIVCAPTYKITPYSNLFNWRVENFNNLLNLDATNNEYAWILDSNQNLTYDDRTFYKQNGSLNNFGMTILITDLCQLMNDILQYKIKENNTGETSSETFFR